VTAFETAHGSVSADSLLRPYLPLKFADTATLLQLFCPRRNTPTRHSTLPTHAATATGCDPNSLTGTSSTLLATSEPTERRTAQHSWRPSCRSGASILRIQCVCATNIAYTLVVLVEQRTTRDLERLDGAGSDVLRPNGYDGSYSKVVNLPDDAALESKLAELQQLS
jgi:hypothetical protein